MRASRLCLRSTSAAATRALGEALGRAMDPLPRAGLYVVLHGDLGAGKTTLVRGLLTGLGVPADVAFASPTFTVARDYQGRMPIHHVDAYHLGRLAEFEAAGAEVLGGEGQVTCVEWGERIPDALPADRLELTLTPVPPTAETSAATADPHLLDLERDLVVEATGRASQRILETFAQALAPSLAPGPRGEFGA